MGQPLRAQGPSINGLIERRCKPVCCSEKAQQLAQARLHRARRRVQAGAGRHPSVYQGAAEQKLCQVRMTGASAEVFAPRRSISSPFPCCSGEDILRKMAGEQVTPRFLERHGFNYPIMVTEMEGLGLKLPPPTFSVLDVERYVGKDGE